MLMYSVCLVSKCYRGMVLFLLYRINGISVFLCLVRCMC